jgi:hypothetical protein
MSVFAGAKWEAALALSNWLIKSNRVQSPDVTQISPKDHWRKEILIIFLYPAEKERSEKN